MKPTAAVWRVFWSFLYLFPAIPLGMAWRELIVNSHERRAINLLPLTVGTISLLWIAVALTTESVLGADYSSTRGAIILGNLIATVAGFLFTLILSFFRTARLLSILTSFGCLVLAFVWLLTAAANAAV
jgi:hypothetical protein